MRILIIKLGATGDVVRTTTLLHILKGKINWLTDDNNVIMLNGSVKIEKCIPWSENAVLKNIDYDFVINLEDSFEVARLLNEIKYKDLFGAYLNKSNKLTYTDSSKEWFDISLASKFGKEKADELKLKNRKTYQEMIFKGMGYRFNGEKYFLPDSAATNLVGDIAIAPESGTVWPMKNWAYFKELKQKLETYGYVVNYLPMRETLLEHIGDLQNHRYLVSGDSLPMHIALGSQIKCLTLFICTSPWEIHDYGVQKKIVSPLLDKYFYKRDFDLKATTSISLDEVFNEVITHINQIEGSQVSN
jgi:lipopolysaccharide heptosyltransferase II